MQKPDVEILRANHACAADLRPPACKLSDTNKALLKKYEYFKFSCVFLDIISDT